MRNSVQKVKEKITRRNLKSWVDAVSAHSIHGWVLLQSELDIGNARCFINGKEVRIQLDFGIRIDVADELKLSVPVSGFTIDVGNAFEIQTEALEVVINTTASSYVLWRGSFLELVQVCTVNRIQRESPDALKYIVDFLNIDGDERSLSSELYLSGESGDNNKYDSMCFLEDESLGIRSDLRVSRYQSHLYWRHTREHPSFRSDRPFKVGTAKQIAKVLIWNLRNLTATGTRVLPLGPSDLNMLNEIVPYSGLARPGKKDIIELTIGQTVDNRIFIEHDENAFSTFLLAWLGSFGEYHRGHRLLTNEQKLFLEGPHKGLEKASEFTKLVPFSNFIAARYFEEFGSSPNVDSFTSIDHYLCYVLGRVVAEVRFAKSKLLMQSQLEGLVRIFAGVTSLGATKNEVGELIGTFLSRIQGAAKSKQCEIQSRHSIQVLGMIDSKSGLGKNARNSVSALKLLNEDFSEYPISLHDRSVLGRPAMGSKGKAAINLIHVNPDNLPELVIQLETATFDGSYNIGFFAWELDLHPKAHMLALQLVDEVWVPSSYVARGFRKYTNKPVIVMPHAVEIVPGKPTVSREYFGIQESSFVAHVSYDLHSWSQRKNPIGSIEAVKLAMKDVDDFAILVKVRNGSNIGRVDSDSDGVGEALLDLAENDPRIILDFEERNDRDTQEMISFSDCYVSLHRSEGFGYSCAEAALLGVPVVATDSSGCSDFLNLGNSFLVSSTERYLGEGEYVYSPAGASWFEPDIEHAAQLINLIKRDRDLAKRLAHNAQKETSINLSLDSMSKAYGLRIKELKQILGIGNFLGNTPQARQER